MFNRISWHFIYLNDDGENIVRGPDSPAVVVYTVEQGVWLGEGGGGRGGSSVCVCV